MVDLSLIGFATAFAAGVISFLSPCVLPLVPGYVSYVTGSSLDELRGGRTETRHVMPLAVAFVAGFSTVFVALGASATLLGQTLLAWRYELGIAAGVVIILFGLHMLGLAPFSLLQRDARLQVETTRGRAMGAYLLGLAFAFGWTPCIGPVLGAILTLGASTADVTRGTTLLLVYAAGLGLPFVLAALFTDRLLTQMRRLARAGAVLQRVAGGVLLAMGLLMVTGQLELIAYWFLETFPALSRLG
jgi:cytochrome c-type biogenesis protein